MVLGTLPDPRIVLTAIFPAVCEFGVKFKVGETVLCPRSQGGFTWAKILRISQQTPAGLTPLDEALVGPKDRALIKLDLGTSTKDIPHILVGKVVGGVPRDLGDAPDPVTTTRELGMPALLSDLEILSFSRRNTFSVDQGVLVPSARGGFTYGVVRPHDREGKNVLIATGHGRERDYRRQSVGVLPLDAQVKGFIDPEGQSDDIAQKPKKPYRPPMKHKASRSTDSGRSTDSASGHAVAPTQVLQRDQYIAETEEVILFKPANASNGGADTPPETTPRTGDVVTASRLEHVPKPVHSSKPVIVIDGPNVACSYGKGEVLAVKGIVMAANHWKRLGHPVVVLMPAYYMDSRAYHSSPLHYVPEEDRPLLEPLKDSGELALTPSQDYDDSYAIRYAELNGGYVMSNDRFRDQLEPSRELSSTRASELQEWLSTHVISFMFIHDKLLPNPDFRFVEEGLRIV